MFGLGKKTIILPGSPDLLGVVGGINSVLDNIESSITLSIGKLLFNDNNVDSYKKLKSMMTKSNDISENLKSIVENSNNIIETFIKDKEFKEYFKSNNRNIKTLTDKFNTFVGDKMLLDILNAIPSQKTLSEDNKSLTDINSSIKKLHTDISKKLINDVNEINKWLNKTSKYTRIDYTNILNQINKTLKNQKFDIYLPAPIDYSKQLENIIRILDTNNTLKKKTSKSENINYTEQLNNIKDAIIKINNNVKTSKDLEKVFKQPFKDIGGATSKIDAIHREVNNIQRKMKDYSGLINSAIAAVNMSTDAIKDKPKQTTSQLDNEIKIIISAADKGASALLEAIKSTDPTSIYILQEIINKLEILNNLKLDKLNENIKELKSFINILSKLKSPKISGLVELTSANSKNGLITLFTNILGINLKAKEFIGTSNEAFAAIEKIKTFTEKLAEISLKQIDYKENNIIINKTKNNITELSKIGLIKNLSKNIKLSNESIIQLYDLVKPNGNLDKLIKKVQNINSNNKQIENLSDSIFKVQTLLYNLASIGNNKDIYKNINNTDNIFNELSKIVEPKSKLNKLLNNLNIITTRIIKSSDIESNIDNIKKVLLSLANLDTMTAAKENAIKSIDAIAAINDIVLPKSILNQLIDNIKKIDGNNTNKLTVINNIKQILLSLASIDNSFDKSVLDTTKSSLTNLNSLVKDKGIISKVLDNLAKLNQNTDTAKSNIETISKVFDAIIKGSTINDNDITQVKSNISAIKDIIEHIKITLDASVAIDTNEQVNIIKEKLQSIRDLYNNDIKLTASAIEGGKADLEKIEKGKDDVAQAAISNKNISKKDLEQSKNTSGEIAAAIMVAAFTMLIGAFIISKNPKLVIDSLKFTAALAVFLGATMSVIIILQKIQTTKAETKLSEIGRLITISALVMLLGVLVVSASGGKLVKSAMLFGVTLSLFIASVLTPINIYGALAKHGMKDAATIGSFIAKCAVIMTIGALVIMLGGEKLIKNAFKFATVLSAFILAVLMPITIYGALAKHGMKDAAAIGSFIAKCATIMMIGALVMMLGGDKFVKSAFKFAIVLSVFIIAVISPIIAMGMLVKVADGVLKHITNLIVKCTLIMLIGALFISIGGGKFVKSALKFAAVLTLFIAVVVLPFVLLSPFLIIAEYTLKRITTFIVVATIVMMIGALMMQAQGGKFVIYALAFGLTLTLFMALVILPFVFIKDILAQAMPGLTGVAIFVVASTIVLLIGALFIEKYGAVSILKFAGLLVSFIGIMSAVFFGLSFLNKSGQLLDASAAAIQMGIAIAILTADMVAIHFAAQLCGGWDLVIKDLPPILAAIGLISLLFFGVAALGKTGAIQEAAIAAMWMGGAISILSAAFVLVHLMHIMTQGKIISDILKLSIAVVIVGLVFAALGALSTFTTPAILAAQQMGIALMVLSGAFLVAHISLLISDPIKDFIKLGLAVAAAGLLFAGIGLLASVITSGSLAAKQMGIALMVLSGAFLVAHVCMILSDPIKDFMQLGLAVAAAGLLFGILGIGPIPVAIIAGSQSALWMSGALVALSVAFLLVNKLLTDTNPIADFASLGLAVAAAGIVFGILGIGPIPIAIALGSATSLAMSAALVILSGAFDIVHELIGGKEEKILNEMDALIESVGKLAVLFGIIGIPPIAVCVAIGSIVTAGMSTALTNLAISVGIVNEILKNDSDKVVKNVETFINITDKLANLFGIIGIPLFGTYVKTGAENILRMGIAIKYLSNSLIALTEAVHIASALGSSEKLGEIVNEFLHVLDDVDDSNVETFIYKSFKVRWAVRPMCEMIEEISSAIQHISTLAVPMKWDSSGNVVAYRQLKEQDFTNAAKGIQQIIKCIGGAIIDVYETAPDGMFDSVFFSGDSPFTKVCKASTEMGEMINAIATGIQTYAEMTVATKWDEKGNPIKFRHLNANDFKNAADNIAQIILLLGGTISTIASGQGSIEINGVQFNAKTFMESIQEIEGGLFSSDKPSKFVQVLRASTQLGELIGNIAQGISTFASSKVPIGYDNNGKPKSYRALKENDFVKASNSVKQVLSILGKAVIDTYELGKYSDGNYFDECTHIFTSNEPSKFQRTIEASLKMSELIGNVANSISKVASLNFADKWDNKGNAIHFIQVEKKHFEDAASNVGLVISTLGSSLITTYNNNPSFFNNDTLKKIIDAVTPMGNLITDIASAIKTYASGGIPEYDKKTGKIIGYTKLEDKDYIEAGTNIGNVIKAVANAIIALYNDPKNAEMFAVTNDNFLSDGESKFATVFNSVSKIGELIKNTADGVQAYASGGIPIYGKDGKIVGYNHDKLDYNAVGTNIGKVLTAVSQAIIDTYTSNKDKFDLDLNGDSPISLAVESIGKIGSVVSNIAEGIQSYANLNIPTYGDKGEVISRRPFKDSDFEAAKTTIGKMITCMADAIYSVTMHENSDNKGLLTLMGQSSEDENSIINKITNVTTDISGLIKILVESIQGIADFKMPIEYKGTEVSKYATLNENSINKMAENLKSLIISIPSAVYTAYQDKNFIAAVNYSNKNSETITKGLNNLGNVISAILEVADNISSYTDSISSLMKHKALSQADDSIKGAPGLLIDINNVAKGFSALAANFNILTIDTSNLNILNDNINKFETAISNVMTAVDTIYTEYTDSYKDSIDEINNGKIFPLYCSVIYKLNEFTAKSIENFENIITLTQDFDAIELHKSLSGIGYVFATLNDIMSNTYKGYSVGYNGLLLFSDKTTIDLYKDVFTNISKLSTHLNPNKIKLDKKDTYELIEKLHNFNKGISELNLASKLKLNKEDSETLLLNTKATAENVRNSINALYTALVKNQPLDENSAKQNENVLSKLFSSGSSNVKKVKGNAELFKLSIIELTKANEHANNIKLAGFETVSKGISLVNSATLKITDSSANKFKQHAKALDNYVKTINSIKIRNIDSLTKLVDSLNVLSKKMGNLDKLTDALANKLSVVLDKLVKELVHAENTIKEAKELQEKRHELIQNSVKEIQSIMDAPLSVEVTCIDDSDDDDDDDDDDISNSGKSTATETKGSSSKSTSTSKTTKH